LVPPCIIDERAKKLGGRMFLTRKQKVIIGLIVAVSAIFMMFFTIRSVNNARKEDKETVKITVSVFPDDAKLYIDNKPSKPGVYKLTNGTHTLRAERKDFATKSEAIATKNYPDGSTKYIMLKPNTKAGEKLLDEDKNLQRQYDQAGDTEYDNGSRIVSEEYPIIKYLPYETLDYSITYSADIDKLSITVKLFPVADQSLDPVGYQEEVDKYKADANSFLKNKGLDLKTADIQYVISP
jgi:hypothetical protein